MESKDLILEMIASYKPDATEVSLDHDNQKVETHQVVADGVGRAIHESLKMVLTPRNKKRANDFAFILHHVFSDISKLQDTKSFVINPEWIRQVESLDVMANCVCDEKVARLAASIAETVPDEPFKGFTGHEKVITALEAAIKGSVSVVKEKTL